MVVMVVVVAVVVNDVLIVIKTMMMRVVLLVLVLVMTVVMLVMTVLMMVTSHSYALAKCGGNGMDRYILLFFLLISVEVWILQVRESATTFHLPLEAALPTNQLCLSTTRA